MEPSAEIRLPAPTPEHVPDLHERPREAASHEQLPEKPETAAGKAEKPERSLPPTLTLPVSDDSQQAVDPPLPVIGTDEASPTVEPHGDRLPKPWLAKVEQTFAETNSDPYRKEGAFGKLRREYQAERKASLDKAA